MLILGAFVSTFRAARMSAQAILSSHFLLLFAPILTAGKYTAGGSLTEC